MSELVLFRDKYIPRQEFEIALEREAIEKASVKLKSRASQKQAALIEASTQEALEELEAKYNNDRGYTPKSQRERSALWRQRKKQGLTGQVKKGRPTVRISSS